MQLIYEQVTAQIKAMGLSGELKECDMLPSVRALSSERKISALTVKKAYDSLEENGFVITVHGKGSYIAPANQELQREEQRKEVETDLELAIQKGRSYGMNSQEIRDLFELIMEDSL